MQCIIKTHFFSVAIDIDHYILLLQGISQLQTDWRAWGITYATLLLPVKLAHFSTFDRGAHVKHSLPVNWQAPVCVYSGQLFRPDCEILFHCVSPLPRCIQLRMGELSVCQASLRAVCWTSWLLADWASVYIAGHFLGNNTVIDVLRSQGYEVEHTPAGQPISR